MNLRTLGLLAACLTVPGLAHAAADATNNDVFDYNVLQVERLHEHSDFFADSSGGTGLRFAYDMEGGVYVFGQWHKLDFDTLGGGHTLQGIGVGAHQAYSSTTSFYIDLSFMRDALDSSLGGIADNYWRVSYGFRNHSTDLIEVEGGIFTERNTSFGGRPFGERLGLGFDFTGFDLKAAVEHAADGNRTMLTLSWNYR
ncbi:MAG TPA: hypothetical protein VHP13_04285 [Gammaproteobacteria bacterium]|jgi:hypothetical protein|nr:hypothetical protein [Gammaproteobacteria bacterium]